MVRNMTRKTFIISSLGGAGLVLTGGVLRNLPPQELAGKFTVDAVKEILGRFKEAPGSIKTVGAWSPNQVFTHCAQSIELSFTGFPEHKGDLFKAVLGKTAFSVFAARGRLSHNLAEQIPGLEEIPASSEPAVITTSIDRLIAAFEKLNTTNGPLKDHFAYGALSVEQNKMAHILHFYNHLEEFPEMTS